MHGAGGASAAMPERGALVLRYFGDDAHFKELPIPPWKASGLPMPWLDTLKHGQPYDVVLSRVLP